MYVSTNCVLQLLQYVFPLKESELVENSLGADAQHPYDGTKYGPLCQQGSMDPAQFSKLNGLIINDIIDKVLQVKYQAYIACMYTTYHYDNFGGG